ncbi:beta-ketoacyl-ACP synthase II [Burkholderia arboris]|uniref:beta-ketoacyl-ACP synthase II n=1 Tax=Burkholderia arboris TaxID=488730 RepID=UPI001CF52ECE|nr:beta-ketoacyl-ACP synthase II [Burkholderia arboris]MCA8049550.1 beta-ketoacyl-ACP synthase II [Burkholderia arboris]
MNANTPQLPHPLGLRRVVVTGLGLVTPLGVGVEHTWRNLLDGRSGITAIDRFDTSHLPCKIAGVIPAGSARDGGFDATEWVEAREVKKMDPFIVYAIAAATEAIDDAQWHPADRELQNRTGVMVGAGIGGLPGIEAGSRQLERTPGKRLSPFFIPSNLINLAAGQISIKYGFRGPTHATVTACASGAHAIGDAARLIALDDADVMIAGGAEAAVCEVGIAGFAAAKALSTGFNDTPERASRPWDADRDGFVMGEGSGMVVLEEYGHALARGARIYAEVIGYGMSGDAYHIVAPPDDGDGAARAMLAALKRARIEPDAIDYINAHSTSTPAGDLAEIAALKRVFGEHLFGGASVSATKASTGHLLGAAGSVEAVFALLALRDQVAPPTINLERVAPECDGLDLVPNRSKSRPVRYALSNSFGFGGTNAALIFGPPPADA